MTDFMLSYIGLLEHIELYNLVQKYLKSDHYISRKSKKMRCPCMNLQCGYFADQPKSPFFNDRKKNVFTCYMEQNWINWREYLINIYNNSQLKHIGIDSCEKSCFRKPIFQAGNHKFMIFYMRFLV